ncbi:MAG: Sua5/YciO/YrdC/YwlC family protein [Lentisphaerae bacterium]|nr:Sua5/YciO/YrdC/YwlC family protein [Lentisphaerota bacterium]
MRLDGTADAAACADAVEAMLAGGLVIVPTDTVYGVAAHPGRPGAVKGLFAAKGRDAGKPIPFLAADIASVKRAGAVFEGAAAALAAAFWPGPLTLVLPVAGSDPEGFRIPAFDPALMLLRAAGGLLRVTSANLSGEPAALTAAAAAHALGASVAAVLDAGPSPGGAASTVVAFRAGRPVVLREGALAAAAIMEACNA